MRSKKSISFLSIEHWKLERFDQTRRDYWFISTGLVLIWLFLVIYKAPNILVEGRFWAEEGAVFFEAITNHPWYQGVFFIYKGHFQLLTNLAVIISSHAVPLRYAPLVTTYAGLFIMSLPVLAVVVHRRLINLPIWGCLMLIVFSVSMPQSNELWLNSTNVQWHLAALTAILLVVPTHQPFYWVTCFALFAAGFTGVPSTFLTPLYFFRAWLDRDRRRLLQALVLTLCAVVQVTLLLINPDSLSDRSLTLPVEVLIGAPLAHSIAGPLGGIELGGRAALMVRRALFGIPESFYAPGWTITLLLGTALITVFYIVARKSNHSCRYLLASYCLFILLGIAGALEPKTEMISVLHGGRYFYAPNIALLLALLIGRDRNSLGSKPNNKTEILSILIAITVTCSAFSLSYNMKNYLEGPSWATALKESRDGVIRIWPSSWTISIREGKDSEEMKIE